MFSKCSISNGPLSRKKRGKPKLFGGWTFLPMMGALVLLSEAHAQAPAQNNANSQEAATVHSAKADIPFSSYASPEAQQALAKVLKAPAGPNPGSSVEETRKFQSKFSDERLAEMNGLYAVTITSETIGAVRTDVVVPKEGIAAGNRNRVLISLHSGGFMWGAGSEALVGAIPIAALSQIKVISIDYRLAPEHKFPAASEDVAAVYQALLKTYKAGNIGIYGCSAGGILAAESVAWFVAHNLPQPGAIATLCGTGAELSGDSAYTAPLLTGQPPVPAGGKPLLLSNLPYFAGVDPHDPLAFPIVSQELLAKFPPTLLLAGSRDFSASSLTVMHRRLRGAGADAELFLFDGLWHAFVMFPTLPESREAYGIVGRFFDNHLGRQAK